MDEDKEKKHIKHRVDEHEVRHWFEGQSSEISIQRGRKRGKSRGKKREKR